LPRCVTRLRNIRAALALGSSRTGLGVKNIFFSRKYQTNGNFTFKLSENQIRFEIPNNLPLFKKRFSLAVVYRQFLHLFIT
jgi:hypothetical protein